MSKKTMSETTAKRRGYVLDKNGMWRKKSVLEKYYEEGYLNLPNSPFSAEQRKEAGELLLHDYHLGNYYRLKGLQINNIRIKSTGNAGIEMSMFYKERYLRAMKYVPYEFWNIVFKVCIEDCTLNNEKEKYDTSLQKKYNVYYRKMLLCHGLDRLINFYAKKIEKSS